MAEYLQPGGARMKLPKEEKQNFFFKVQNMNKSIIAQCILDTLVPSSESTVVIVLSLLISHRKLLT